MQEIRCVKCHKLLGKIKRKNGKFIVMSEQLETVNKVLDSLDDDAELEIQCPHNYRDENGKNVQCKTLNKVVI